MDLRRFVLVTVLALISYLLWTAWQQEFPTPKAQPVASEELSLDNHGQQYPNITEDNTAAVRSDSDSSIFDVSPPVTQIPTGRLISVQTDVLNITIDEKSGKLIHAGLLKYPVSLDEPKHPVILFNDKPETQYYAESTLLTSNKELGDSDLIYQSKQKQYQLAPGQDKLFVDLVATNSHGIEFNKRYVFSRNNYAIGLEYSITNHSALNWQGHLATLLSRTDAKPQSKRFVRTYFGASISSDEKPYQKISFKKMKKENVSEKTQGGWAAMQQHYFLGAWVPEQHLQSHYFSRVSSAGLYSIGMYGPAIKIAPGNTQQATSTLYVGPEIPGVLEQLAPHLNMTVDYGWLWIISEALFWLMQHFYDIVGNWGWSIILVTMLVKLLFYPLSAKSYRSMSAMKKLQPKLLALRERYGDDRQKMSQATMELYRKEKVNPFGGCLPILIQIPVFIALYWVLIESVELRQAPFIFWIKDLAVKDPFYILPLLMGVSMFIQQKLNPPPPDPTQAKVMMFLPVMFTVLFMNFPAGLVLYWVVNNTLSILQQWYVTQKYSGNKGKKGNGAVTLEG